MEKVVFDTDVFIEFFNGNTELLTYINKNISFENIVTTVITEAELIKSAVNKESQQKIEKFLTDVEKLPITINASNTFSELIKKYHLSHSAKLPDCLIASICISRNLPLFTFNIKDFKYIPVIKLINHNISPYKKSWWQ